MDDGTHWEKLSEVSGAVHIQVFFNTRRKDDESLGVITPAAAI